MNVMPNASRAGFGLETTPTMAAHFLTGYVPRIFCYPYEGDPPMHHHQSARTTLYDAALARHLPRIHQLVILGAGMDTRVHGLSPEDKVRCFEIDQPLTQTFELKMMETAGLPTNQATYVAADLQTEDWLENLAKAGFDTGRTTFVPWEAVPTYLDRASVEATLGRVARMAPAA
jgi:methyltransferase (TIGR00027 family)